MVGSLYLSEGAHLPPCKLCWYQRIAMYSLAVILVVAVVRRDWNVKPYALTLGVIGPYLAGGHASRHCARWCECVRGDRRPVKGRVPGRRAAGSSLGEDSVQARTSSRAADIE